MMFESWADLIIGIVIGIALTGFVIERPSRRKWRYKLSLRAMDISEARMGQALKDWRQCGLDNT